MGVAFETNHQRTSKGPSVTQEVEVRAIHGAVTL